MMHLKPVHHGLGLTLLSILVTLGCSPSQETKISSSLTDTSEIQASPSEASAANPDSVDETSPDFVDETSADPKQSIDSPVVEPASEPTSQPDSLQASNTIVQIARSEISEDEWRVVESELASFYAQKNSSPQPPFSPGASLESVLNH